MITTRRACSALLATAIAGALSLGTISSAAAHPSKIVARSGFGDVAVRCPAHHHVTGGGVDIEHDDELTVLRSRPTQDGRGWEGAAWGEVDDEDGKNKKGEKDGERPRALPITVYAVCMPG